MSEQIASRKKSSVASQKFKSKFKKRSPDQTFKIGDLVLLREGLTKTKPRETFIVDTLPSEEQDFILIRKLTQSLRPKLYKALPEELILSPTPKTDERSLPRRHAAIKADSKIKHCVSRIYPAKKSIFKHGWNETDQIMETDDLMIPFHQPDPEHSTSLPDPQSRSPGSRSDASNSSMQDLTWDDAPCQYDLSETFDSDVNTPDPSPFPTSTSFPRTDCAPVLPFIRTRLFGSSDQALSRTPAFRLHRSDQAFLTTPQPSSLLPLPMPPTKKSRIPTPRSPSRIALQDVADFSNVLHLPDPPRRSSRISRLPPQAELDARRSLRSRGTEEEKKKYHPYVLCMRQM